MGTNLGVLTLEWEYVLFLYVCTNGCLLNNDYQWSLLAYNFSQSYHFILWFISHCNYSICRVPASLHLLKITSNESSIADTEYYSHRYT